MPRTQLDERNLSNNVLTGASFKSEMGFYDETANYVSTDRIWWKGTWYEANTTITGGDEGVMTNAPDINTDWDAVPNLLWSAYTSTAQTYNNTPVVLDFDTERQSNSNITLNTGGSITFGITGTFILHYEYSANVTTSTRAASNSYLSKSTDGGTSWTPITNSSVYNYHRNNNY